MKQITMKKKVKQLCCILLAVILCMGMTVPAMAASSRYYNAAISSYKKYVKGKRGSYKIVEGIGVRDLNNSTQKERRIIDIPFYDVLQEYRRISSHRSFPFCPYLQK